jgi:hypothetical protein
VCQWYDDDTRNCYGQSCRSAPPAHLPTVMMVVAQPQEVSLVQFPVFSRAQGAGLSLPRIDQPWIPRSPASPSLFPCTRCWESLQGSINPGSLLLRLLPLFSHAHGAERAYKDWSILDPSFSGFSFSFPAHKVLSKLTRIDQPWIPSSPASPGITGTQLVPC